jgi:hypothetical protein
VPVTGVRLAEPSGCDGFQSQGETRQGPVPVQAMTLRLIEEYLTLAGHGADTAGPVFRSVIAARSRLGLPQHRPEIWARNRY